MAIENANYPGEGQPPTAGGVVRQSPGTGMVTKVMESRGAP